MGSCAILGVGYEGADWAILLPDQQPGAAVGVQWRGAGAQPGPAGQIRAGAHHPQNRAGVTSSYLTRKTNKK